MLGICCCIPGILEALQTKQSHYTVKRHGHLRLPTGLCSCGQLHVADTGGDTVQLNFYVHIAPQCIASHACVNHTCFLLNCTHAEQVLWVYRRSQGG